MADIYLFRMRPGRMEMPRFAAMAERLGVEGRPVEAEEALAVQDGRRALAYAQPGSKFGGLLFFTDQSQSMAQVADRLPEPEMVSGWARDFVEGFELLPRDSGDERIRLDIRLRSYQTHAVAFDGKERKKVPVKTEIGSKIRLGDVAVTGPRAKVRMAFASEQGPVWIHRALWETLEVYDTREAVSSEEAVSRVRDRLGSARSRTTEYSVRDISLAYYATEYAGGPDLLTPVYFVEVEFEDREATKLGIEQGPRQVVLVPGYR